LVLKQSDVVQFFGVICVQPSGVCFVVRGRQAEVPSESDTAS